LGLAVNAQTLSDVFTTNDLSTRVSKIFDYSTYFNLNTQNYQLLAVKRLWVKATTGCDFIEGHNVKRVKDDAHVIHSVLFGTSITIIAISSIILLLALFSYLLRNNTFYQKNLEKETLPSYFISFPLYYSSLLLLLELHIWLMNVAIPA